ncbi:hypothetical protein BpHYR1_028024, partial [Brachionus plicatilis]
YRKKYLSKFMLKSAVVVSAAFAWISKALFFYAYFVICLENISQFLYKFIVLFLLSPRDQREIKKDQSLINLAKLK